MRWFLAIFKIVGGVVFDVVGVKGSSRMNFENLCNFIALEFCDFVSLDCNSLSYSWLSYISKVRNSLFCPRKIIIGQSLEIQPRWATEIYIA